MQVFLTFVLLLTAIDVTKCDIIDGLLDILDELIEFAKIDSLDGVEPDAILPTLDVISLFGYPAEKHEVITKDGYILELHRIPFGKHNSSRHRRPPLLCMHGFAGSSQQWLLKKEDSAAFFSADVGYDVWLGNLRGNEHSTKHLHFTSNDPRYWNFNLDDHAHLDLSATIDYILNVTQFNKLSYIGISAGATVALLLLAESPEYNDKITLAVFLQPVIYLRHMNLLSRMLFKHIEVFKLLIAGLGSKRIMVSPPVVKKLLRSICTDHPGVILCEAFFSPFAGFNEEEFDLSRLYVFSTRIGTSTSADTFANYAQWFNEDKIAYFDFGTEANLLKYGQPEPPIYNFSKISAPTATYYAEEDLFVDARDAQRLTNEMANISGVLRYVETVPYWTHGDFGLAINAKELFYKRLLKTIQSIT